jgi:hypothetical protein
MGTRNVTCVVLNDEMKVAQYCQWDGYPSGQGATVWAFLHALRSGRLASDNLELFKRRIAALTEVGDEEVAEKWTECGAEGEWVGMDVVEEFNSKYAHLSRDMGAKVLDGIMKGEITEVSLNTEFPGNSLFCEWAYVIDLDNEALEVYEGFVKEPHTEGRFCNMPPYDGGSTYYPVKLKEKIPFNELPATEEEFVAMFEEDDEE